MYGIFFVEHLLQSGCDNENKNHVFELLDPATAKEGIAKDRTGLVSLVTGTMRCKAKTKRAVMFTSSIVYLYRFHNLLSISSKNVFALMLHPFSLPHFFLALDGNLGCRPRLMFLLLLLLLPFSLLPSCAVSLPLSLSTKNVKMR